jgi:PPOX class probable F420-dependent enzyme
MFDIPENLRYLLDDETKAFAFLATTMSDGSPQVTPVWFNTDGKHILINTARGRAKDRNMTERPQVALAIPDPEDTYRYIQIRGRVVEITEVGALEHIHHLSRIYRGKDWQVPPNQIRVIYKILLESIDAHA